MGLEGIASFVSNNLLDDGQTERLIFRKFKGDKLLVAAVTGTELKSTDVETVALAINPQEISYTSQKIINKVPTNAPGRFVVFDWGNDLTILNISGVTGNLLPDVATGKLDPLSPVRNMIDTLTAATGQGNKSAWTRGNSTTKDIAAFTGDLVTSQLSYFDILKMSKKYRTFKKLQKLFDMFDADKDVVTLEMGEIVYRGYFTEFRFSVSKDSPWNWSYTMGFVVLNDLSEKKKRNDDVYPENDDIISKED